MAEARGTVCCRPALHGHSLHAGPPGAVLKHNRDQPIVRSTPRMRHAALPPPLLPPPLQLLVLLHHLAPNVRNSLCTSTILGCAAGAGVCRVPLLPCRCMRCTPVSTMHGCAAGAGVCRVPLLPCRCMRCTPVSTMHGCAAGAGVCRVPLLPCRCVPLRGPLHAGSSQLHRRLQRRGRDHRGDGC